MSARLRDKNILRIAKEILGFAGLTCLALACAAPSWAGTNQAAANQTGAPPATTAPKPAANASPGAPVPAAASPASAERSRGGNHEGITVHGHWTIEVKNPDGTVTARREFENAIKPTGMSYLASLLAGNNGPGGLSIVLNGGTAVWAPPNFPLSTGFGSEAGPCLQVTWLFAGLPGPVGGQPTGTACLITAGTNTSGYATELGSICAYSLTLAAQANQLAPCSTNLMTNGPTLTAASDGSGLATALSLTGSVVVSSPNAGNVTDVETVFQACDANSTANNCLNVAQVSTAGSGSLAGTTPVAVNVFTQKNLNGPANGNPAPVAYSPLQTIAVTVTISFQ